MNHNKPNPRLPHVWINPNYVNKRPSFSSDIEYVPITELQAAQEALRVAMGALESGSCNCD